MGVVHWMPLGTSPGAVTSALAHLWNAPDFGHRSAVWGRTVEGIVLFTPTAIKEGKILQDRCEICTYNAYGSLNAKGKTYRNENVVKVVVEYIAKECAGQERPAVYWGEAFAYDYDQSFRSAVEGLVLFLARPNHKGKHLWLNLTGGTNVMNAALLQMAFLSGLISQAYYTWVPLGSEKYLQPTSDKHFKFVPVPLVKAAFDDAYYMVLEAVRHLQQGGGWVGSDELLGLLKNQQFWLEAKQRFTNDFEPVDRERLEKEFLTKMDGHGLTRRAEADGRKTNEVRLAAEGESLLATIGDPLFQALTRRGQTETLDQPFTHRWEKYDWETSKWQSLAVNDRA